MSESGKVQYGQLVRIATVLLLVVLMGVLVFQNQEVVEVRVLLAKFSMPRAALIFVAFFLGLIAGMVAMWAFAARRRRGQTG